MTQIIFLYITREFFFNILHTMNCFVTYSKSCKHLSLFLPFLPLPPFLSLRSPTFIPSPFPTPLSVIPFFSLKYFIQRAGPGGPESHSIQTSPVHTSLMAQKAAQGAKRRTHKPCNTEGRPGEPRQVHTSLQHRQQAQGAKTSAHKHCHTEGRPGEMREMHTSPAT